MHEELESKVYVFGLGIYLGCPFWRQSPTTKDSCTTLRDEAQRLTHERQMPLGHVPCTEIWRRRC
jgi:hypothetical protein